MALNALPSVLVREAERESTAAHRRGRREDGGSRDGETWSRNAAAPELGEAGATLPWSLWRELGHATPCSWTSASRAVRIRFCHLPLLWPVTAPETRPLWAAAAWSLHSSGCAPGASLASAPGLCSGRNVSSPPNLSQHIWDFLKYRIHAVVLSSAGRLNQHPSEHLRLPRVPRNPFLSCRGPMARLVSLTLPTLTVLPSWGQSWSPGCTVASGCLQASGALGPLWSKLPSRPGRAPASPPSAAALLSLARVQLTRHHCLPTVPWCGPHAPVCQASCPAPGYTEECDTIPATGNSPCHSPPARGAKGQGWGLAHRRL